MTLATIKFALLVSVLLSVASFPVAVAQEINDQTKIEIYKRFTDNRLRNPTAAYQAAKDYLQKYESDNDRYSDYIGKWVLLYERDERKRNLPLLINQKNFAEAFRTGAQILADEPDYLRAQIDLGYAGYLAASAKDETHNSEALGYGRKAIESIQSGKTPAEWAPFKGKDDTLAYLNYAVGYLTLKTNPDEAIDSLLKAAQYDSAIRTTPSTYYFLAAAYESGPYETMSAAYKNEFASKPDNPATKALLERLNVVIDRIIDAYARAISAAGNDSRTERSRKDWLSQLSVFYKYRHNGTDAGITEYVASALQRPLPPKPEMTNR